MTFLAFIVFAYLFIGWILFVVWPEDDIPRVALVLAWPFILLAFFVRAVLDLPDLIRKDDQ